MEMSHKDPVFESAEIRVAAFNELTAEQGRALYAAYAKRGAELAAKDAEIARLKASREYDEVLAKRAPEYAERIIKLEAALREITKPWIRSDMTYDQFASEALEGK